jgi:polynucleotide 5'-hydroxyl-kinase GRC3/NOL9
MPGPAAGLHKVFPEGRGAFGLQGVHPIFHSTSGPIYRYSTPSTWLDALERIGRPAVVREEWEAAEDPAASFVMIVKGAKRSGKSTFAREAVNRLLQK